MKSACWLCLLICSCAASSALKKDDQNNVMAVHHSSTIDSSQNSSVQVIFKGHDNIFENNIDSSEVKGKNNHDVLIIEGDHNHVEMNVRNIKDHSSNSTDTIVIRSDHESVTFFASDLLDSTDGSSGKEIITVRKRTQLFEATLQDFITDSNTLIFIPLLNASLPAPDAIRFYERYADQGDPEIYYQVGLLYQAGYGTTINIAKAVNYFRIASAWKHTMAQFALGRIFQTGEGNVQRDVQKAIYFYKLAARNGDKDAMQELQKLMK